VSQFDKDDVEKAGLVKFDFLGLTTLTIIAESERNIRALGEPDFSIEKDPARRSRPRTRSSRRATPSRSSSSNRAACATSS
jgi:hypothetical protein